ncbi:MAG: hypothetical protein IJR33_07520, partial [Clostridia bacterium]|nr:hypothetical protein [Clostridia bacterium]
VTERDRREGGILFIHLDRRVLLAIAERPGIFDAAGIGIEIMTFVIAGMMPDVRLQNDAFTRKHAFFSVRRIQTEFVDVAGHMDTEDMRKIVQDCVEKIEAMKPTAVMAAGEFTFIFMLVDKLLQDGIKVMCTCSRRLTTETKRPDGSNEKTSVFVFERFRDYDYFTKRGEA